MKCCLPLWFHRLPLTLALASLLLCGNTPALAAPGAHGPNGEHLDGPTITPMGTSLPRLETASESFEMVARLQASELSVLIDRYETNEPVLGATLEVETGGINAVAQFHADVGDYSFTDEALLKRLATPGEHVLVFTLIAGTESDLLDGTLVTETATTAHGHGGHGHNHSDHPHHHHHGRERAVLIGGGMAVIGLIGGGLWWRNRRKGSNRLKGVV